MFKIFKAKKEQEIGVIGNIATYGYSDEKVKQLRGSKKYETYREMATDDAIIFGVLYIIKALLIKTDWKIKVTETDKNSVQDGIFVEECLADMSFTFSDFIDEILTMVEFGFSYFEIVYKLRNKINSKYTDNKIGWKKFAFRSQETITRWEIDTDGGIRGAYQNVSGNEVFLPIEKCLLFRTSTRKNNPEGYSLLRGCHKSWYYKTHIEKFEAIGIERDLAGLPKISIPASVISKDGEELNEFKKVASNIKVDEQMGIVIPSDTRDGHRLYDIELLTSSGSKSFNTNEIIARHEQRIAMSLCADFMLLGQGGTGSWALSTDKTDMFQLSLNAITKKISEVFNQYMIPRLFVANGIEREVFPEFVFEPVAKKDLTQVAQILTSLSNAGMPLFPNPILEENILKMLGVESNEL